MKTKHILHLVTFVLTFAVSVTVAGAVKSFRGLSTSEKISNVISQDISNGRSSRKNCRHKLVSLALKTNEYVDASSRLDVSGLPNDFQIAWQKHMEAWKDHSNYLNEKRFSKDFRPEYDQISTEQTDEINRTWYDVLDSAKSHGAVIPISAYY